MKMSNISSPSGAGKTVLEVVRVKASSNPNRAGFDSEAKDFLQDAGFIHLKVGDNQRHIIGSAPSEDILLLLEHDVQADQNNGHFWLIRIQRGTRREIETGRTMYVESVPNAEG